MEYRDLKYMDIEEKVKQDFWPKVKKVLGKVPFIPDAVAMYYAMLDPDTPVRAKATIAGALLYFIVPIDAIPDFFLGGGYLDDAGVIALALTTAHSHVLPKHKEQAKKVLELE